MSYYGIKLLTVYIKIAISILSHHNQPSYQYLRIKVTTVFCELSAIEKKMLHLSIFIFLLYFLFL